VEFLDRADEGVCIERARDHYRQKIDYCFFNGFFVVLEPVPEIYYLFHGLICLSFVFGAFIVSDKINHFSKPASDSITVVGFNLRSG
jgi:hypothetical protein